MDQKESLPNRFWSKVDFTGDPIGCWIWRAATNPKGYGRFVQNGRLQYAHRVSWELHFGPIPEHLGGPFFICHKCDNPRCVRPDHLFLGTVRDNAQDAIAKGHWDPRYCGEESGKAVLTWKQVREIRAKYRPWKYSQRRLAREYSVSAGAIAAIVQNRNWRE